MVLVLVLHHEHRLGRLGDLVPEAPRAFGLLHKHQMFVTGGTLRVSGGLFLSFSYLRETTSSSPKKRAVVVMMAAATAEARAEAREVVARVEVNEVNRVAVKAAMAEAVYGVGRHARRR